MRTKKKFQHDYDKSEQHLAYSMLADDNNILISKHLSKFVC